MKMLAVILVVFALADDAETIAPLSRWLQEGTEDVVYVLKQSEVVYLYLSTGNRLFLEILPLRQQSYQWKLDSREEARKRRMREKP